jgi:predicted phage-related endonuclease
MERANKVSKGIEEFEALVADAKAKLIAGRAVVEPETGKLAVEAEDAVSANELLAERSALDDEIKALEARKKAIDAIIKTAIGEADELLVHGAKVASISRWRETSVQTDAVKEMFPLLDFPELYKRTDKSRLNIH